MIGVRGFFVKTEQGKTKGLDTSGPSGERIDRRTLFPPVYRSTTQAGLLLFAAAFQYMTTESRPMTVPPVNQPWAPSFQVKSPYKLTINPRISQISADNALILPS